MLLEPLKKLFNFLLFLTDLQLGYVLRGAKHRVPGEKVCQLISHLQAIGHYFLASLEEFITVEILIELFGDM
jgi:hypothetical protein